MPNYCLVHIVDRASVVIGGEAGDGVRAAGGILGKIFNRHGLYSFVREDYQSLIRGGHNFSQIIASPEKVWSQYDEAEIVVALDERTVENHKDRLSDDGVLIYDSDNVDYDGSNSEPVPMSSMVEDVEGIEIMRNSVALGIASYLYGLELEKVKEVLKDEYGEKAGKNIELAEKAYDFGEESLEKIKELDTSQNENLPIITGNQAISLGASKAGLDIYIAYPMTPSTSILHFTAAHKEELGLSAVQAENEISVINMALGAAYGGARSMVGTSGGGFALMQEAISLTGLSELPLLIIECQRAGPSTGVPTYTSQADLDLVLGSGHGEFPFIALAAGDQEEAYYLAGEGLNLAWKYQVPVILMSDKHLSESRMTSEIDYDEVSIEEPKIAEDPGEDYERYEITEDGISPLHFPGLTDSLVQATSYEHLESGYTTEDPDRIVEMQEKRKQKWNVIKDEVLEKDTVNVFGDKDSENIVLVWGSTKGTVKEALKHLDENVKVVQPIYLKPFPREEVSKHLENAEKVITVEANATGQLAELLRKELLTEVDDKILKYDMRPFNPIKLSEKLEEVFNE